ncbi:hypothetical protein JS958_003107 [Salmonella enterica subsp. enterica serovar Infantis]|nr:hypothetical protein [Salmonella enterica subsp. enterica serovar Infantis]
MKHARWIASHLGFLSVCAAIRGIPGLCQLAAYTVLTISYEPVIDCGTFPPSVTP